MIVVRSVFTSDFGSYTLEQVNYESVYGKSKVDWTDFEREARYFRITNRARVENSAGESVAGPQQILDADGLPGERRSWRCWRRPLGSRTVRLHEVVGHTDDGDRDGDYLWDVLAPNVDPTEGHDDYSLPSAPLPPEGVARVTEDGDEEEFTVCIGSTESWYDEDGNSVLDETWVGDIVPTVFNEEADAEAESSGTGSVAGPSTGRAKRGSVLRFGDD